MRTLISQIVMAIGLCLASHGAAWSADPYPARPVRFIVTYPPGGSTDFVARVLQPHVERLLGQPIVIDNRPGAGGVIGVDVAAKASPDGYTIVLSGAGALATNVGMHEKLPYDPQRDLTPITNVARMPFILGASPAFKDKSLRDVIAMAKGAGGSGAGGLAIGHGGNGTGMHLTAQLFNHMTGLNLPLVPYRGTGPVTKDLVGGHIPLGVTDPPSALSLIKTGEIKALAVSTVQRFALLPDIPTVAEAGVPGFETAGWFGLLAPAGTPNDLIIRLNQVFVSVLNQPEVAERFRSVGAETAPMTPAEFATFMRSEAATRAKLVAESAGKVP
jgi:tripartite-type tricarboxylate transporter receptor subunit TctC